MSYFNLVMDLSNNMFAFHLCGVMTAVHEAGNVCPDPEAEALGYLKVFYPEALAEFEEANELTKSNPLTWS